MSANRVSWNGPDDELPDVTQAATLLTVKPSTLAHWARESGPTIRLHDGLLEELGRQRITQAAAGSARLQ